MVEKECGTFDKAIFPSIWEPIGDQHGLRRWVHSGIYSLVLTGVSYRHVVTGERRDGHPALVRGGVLADVS